MVDLDITIEALEKVIDGARQARGAAQQLKAGHIAGEPYNAAQIQALEAALSTSLQAVRAAWRVLRDPGD